MNSQNRPRRASLSQRRTPENAVIVYITAFISLWLIILLFTPFTYHLDELKVSMTYVFGPFLIFMLFALTAKTRFNSFPRKLMLPLVIYFVVMLVSTLLSSFKWIGWIVIGQQLAYTGFFLAFAASLVNKRTILNAVYMFVWIGMVTTIFGILQYTGMFTLIRNEFFPGQPTKLFEYGRILINTFAKANDMFSTILNRDFFSGFLVMIIPLSLAGTIVFESPRRRFISVITLILECVCLYLTLSKDSFAAFVITIALFLIIYSRSIHYKKLHIPNLHIWIIGTALIVGTLLFFTQKFVMMKLKGVDRSFRSRSIIWGGSLKQFYDSPIIGNGPGTFRVLFPKYRRADYFEHDISNVTLFSHNRYLDLLCETGLLGFLTFMWFFVVVLLLGFRQIFRGRDPALRTIQLALSVSIVGLLMTNFFSPSVSWVVIGTTFWSIVGISVGCSLFENQTQGREEPKTVQRSPISPQQRKYLMRAGIVISGIIALVSTVYAVRYFMGAYYHNRGFQLLELKLYRQAGPEFEKALKYNPTFITSYYKLAHVYSSLGQDEKALQIYRKLQEYAPDYAEIHYNIGVIKLKLGQVDQALDDIREASRQSEKVQTRFMAGNILFQYGLFEEAKKYFLDVINMEPTHEDALKKLVQTTQFLHQYDETEKYLHVLYDEYPEDEAVVDGIFTLYRFRDKYQELEEFLENAVHQNPLALKPRLFLMITHINQGHLEEALVHANVLLKLGYKDQLLYYNLAHIYETLGDLDKTREYLLKTIAIDSRTSEGRAAEKALQVLQQSPKEGT